MNITLPVGLFLVFLVLKLCHVIAWSWWWVTSPLWIGAVLWFFFFVIFVAAAVIGIKISESARFNFRKRK